ncbi:hypothetical protein GCM10010211_71460 [Streptomyces albospinus]|uniref:Uncharacterized protein n=1 Tax=Streptomyces albospinus TaxID=285515 RepID=A0ABQ2VP60_9ACTN|nr:hypothetical protein GCM10010211_71460 [Streptomyces albospinus]
MAAAAADVAEREGVIDVTCEVRPRVGKVRMRQQLLGVPTCRQVRPEVAAEPTAGQLAAQEAGDHFVLTAHTQ